MKLLLCLLTLMGGLHKTGCEYEVAYKDPVYKDGNIYKSYKVLELGELNHLSFELVGCEREGDSIFFRFILKKETPDHREEENSTFQLSNVNVVQKEVNTLGETYKQGEYELQKTFCTGGLNDTVTVGLGKQQEYNWLFEYEGCKSLYLHISKITK